MSSSRCNLAISAPLSSPTPFTINFCSELLFVPFLAPDDPQQQFRQHLRQQENIFERHAKNGAQHRKQHIKHFGQHPLQHVAQQQEHELKQLALSSSPSVALLGTQQKESFLMDISTWI